MIIIIICFIIFELIDYVFIPLSWFILKGRKKHNHGVIGMIREVVEIKRWNKTEGQVLVNGEIWRAICDVPLTQGR